MGYKYIMLAGAQQEYEEAIAWYDEKSRMAAEQFVDAIDYTIALICEHPDRWRNEYHKFHELGLRKYPYSIVYTIQEDTELVIIASIYHHSRNPKKKYRK